MARLNVNPTRQELKRLKGRLTQCVRGHKLLKDKADEMVRVFSVRLRETYRLRIEAEQELAAVAAAFSMAGAQSSRQELELAFAIPSVRQEIGFLTKSVMGVDVPDISVSAAQGTAGLPYSFVSVTSEADFAVRKINELLPKLLLLAASEHAVRSLGDEIEKNKRRVNALEYVMIPELEETIHYIRLKLDENERGNLARLMKVKEILKES